MHKIIPKVQDKDVDSQMNREKVIREIETHMRKVDSTAFYNS